ncbi:uncharacterized protein involved in type VI secretion and phage assembly [Jatrophihabitans sp. GAS493]|uniref:phage baseplate assembly protein V n=1 Tax=Jatrophihabitans sp. GAS493 TaxID=1907575 RepID=UPI000BC08738|nr:phage baseplate assembly protein V [Jatrophihabitans sp. GAS493]SOD70947.1 uncharacterized protein involved in type VI secretion and phage assembly [Jatrophihabitans sp. GAS493]
MTEVLSPYLTANGAELPTSWLAALTAIRIERGIGEVGRATLTFIDENYELATQRLFSLGSTVTLAAGDRTELMRGVVTGTGIESGSSGVPHLSVVVHEATFRMTRNSQSRSFAQVKYSDIVSKLASEHGLQADVASSPGLVPYLLQSGSDFDFLNAVVERAGFVWWMHEGTLLAKPRGTSSGSLVTTTMGEDLLEYSVSATALRPNKVVVGGWDARNQQDLVGSEAETATTFVPDATIFDGYKSSKSLGDAVFTTAGPTPADGTEATLQARSIMNELAASALVARGTCHGSALLRPSVTITLANAGPASGSYLLTRIEHRYDSRGFETRFTAGGYQPATLLDTLGGGRRSDGGGLSFAHLTVGIVTDVNDPDKMGSVKIRFNSMGAGVDVGSSWARLMTVGAGANRGVVFQPEINDEVLVAFEDGDTRRPVVLGGLFSAKKPLPNWAVEGSAVSARRITSRDGHFIEFSDGSDPATKHLKMELKSGHLIRLGDDKFDIAVSAGKPVAIKAGESTFVIDAQGDVTITANNINLKAKQKVNIEGLEVNVKAQVKASVQGVQVEVKGSGTAEVSASGPLTLKGAMVAIN